MSDRITALPKDMPILNQALQDIAGLQIQIQQMQAIINALRKKAGI